MKDSELCQLSIEHWKRMIEKLKWITESNLNIDLMNREEIEIILDENHYGDYCILCSEYFHRFRNCNKCPINIFDIRCQRYNSLWNIVNRCCFSVKYFIEKPEENMIPMLYKVKQKCIEKENRKTNGRNENRI